MILPNVKIRPELHDFLIPDEWSLGSSLKADSGFWDSEFPGCQFRVESNTDSSYKFAVNIKVTGKTHWVDEFRMKARCKIEFVGDGEPSTFSGGWLVKYAK